MLPEVKEYYETLEGSSEYYTAQRKVETDNPVARWDSRWGAEKRAEWYAADKKRTDATTEFRHSTRERHHVAEQVLKTHSDPVIKWLMTDRVLADYTGYRDEVLQALPMTREEMDSFGDRKNWCGEYARMLERAEKAGVLPERVPDYADFTAVATELSNLMGGRRERYERVLNRHMPALAASYQERAAEREKAAETAAPKKRVSRKKASVTVAA